MTVLEQLISIRDKKIKEHRFPTHIMIEEIDYQDKEVRKELSRLFKEGRIRFGDTINSKFIEVL